MAKPRKKLCVLCERARTDPHATRPTHLVHPKTEELGLYDVHGMAKCRICGASWRRVRNDVGLVG